MDPSAGDGTNDDGAADGDGETGGDGAANGDGANDGSTGGDGSDGDGSSSPGDFVTGCPNQRLRAGIPDDLAAHGPWPVGALTTTLGGIPTEVWYPARPGSESGKDAVTYDVREHLPEADRSKLPDEHNPLQPCDCFRDLPLDEEAGPYPVILFIHGTAGFRTTNLENVTHWASRGFVVVASDHPGIRLEDMLAGSFGMSDQAGDGRKVLAELLETQGDLAFLAGHIDPERVGLLGHSAGGQAVASMGDLGDVIVVYAAGATVAEDRVESMMQLAGSKDGVAGGGQGGYDGSTTERRRFASITNGGHLVGGNLCTIRDPMDPSKNILDLANEYQLGNALVRTFAGRLFDGCNELPDDNDPFIAASRGIEIMNFMSSGVFEETLHCADTASRLSAAQTTFGSDLTSYAETLP